MKSLEFAPSAVVRATLCAFLVAIPLCGHALDIVPVFKSSASDSYPGHSFTEFQNVINAAANYWEDIIEDPWTLTIEYYWDDINAVAITDGPLLPQRVTSTRIRFNATEEFWFDSTPFDNSEFQLYQRLSSHEDFSQLTQQFGGAIPSLLEIGYYDPGEPISGYDLFTVALHEMGHALGLNSGLGNLETLLDGDYDFSPDFVWGASMHAFENQDSLFYDGHLEANVALMNDNQGQKLKGTRYLPSATDVFAIAAASGWTQIDLPRKDFYAVSGSNWTTAANWTGNRIPDNEDDVYIRHKSSINTSNAIVGEAAGSGRRVFVSGAGTVWNNSGSLTVGKFARGWLTISDGGQVSDAGGLIYLGREPGSTGQLAIESNGQLSAAIEYVGYNGAGSVEQTGGTNTVSNALTLGSNVGGRGEYMLSGSGSLSASSEYVGYQGSGSFTQIGGTNSAGTLQLGAFSGAWGDYYFDGGQLSTTTMRVANAGSGLFVNVGGTHTTGALTIGSASGSSGHYSLDGGSLDAANEVVGDGGVGNVSHTAGTNAAGSLVLGREATATGTYSLSGNAELTVENDVVIGYGGEGTFLQDGATHVVGRNLYVGRDSGGSGAYELGGGGQLHVASTLNIGGFKGAGNLTAVEGADIFAGSCSIGYNPDTTGHVSLDDAGTTLNCNGDLYVGTHGDGRLDIGSGASVVAANVTANDYFQGAGTIAFDGGTLTCLSLSSDTRSLLGSGTINTHGLVSDVNLVFNSTRGVNQTFTIAEYPSQNITVNLDADGAGPLGVGYGGLGSLQIADGVAISSSDALVGYHGEGVVTIDGNGSSWTSDYGSIGNELGIGRLSITNGGLMACGDGGFVIGSNFGSSGSSVAVDGSGSTLHCSGYASVGFLDDGAMSITRGAVVSCDKEMWIADQYGVEGHVSVEGNGSLLSIADELYVSHWGGEASLLISGGGTVTSGDGYIAYGTGYSGKIAVDGIGSTWSSGEISVGGDGSATLTISDGGRVNCIDSYIGDGGGDGYVEVSGPGSTFSSSGYLSVGEYGIGTLRIENGGVAEVGEEAVVAGASGYPTLSIGIGADGPGLLHSLGGIALGNHSWLEITVDPATVISGGDSFTIIKADGGFTDAEGGVIDHFRRFSYPTYPLSGDLFWELRSDGNGVLSIGVETPYATDLDIDGDVDKHDLAILQKNFGDSGFSGADFLAWQREYTGDLSLQAGSAAVPEPKAFAFAAAALIMLATRRQIAPAVL